jgi:hypothetical protein
VKNEYEKRRVIFQVDFLFQVVTSSDAGQQVVTEVLQAERAIHDEALPCDVSNAWHHFCVASNLAL